MTLPYAQAAYAQVKAAVEAELKRFGVDKTFLETRHLEYIDAILDSETWKEAEERAKKAFDKVHTSLCARWGEKKIPGIITSDTVEKDAARADSLARSLEKRAEEKGNTPEEIEKYKARAESQRLRANKLRIKAEALRNGQPIPVEEPRHGRRGEGEDPHHADHQEEAPQRGRKRARADSPPVPTERRVRRGKRVVRRLQRRTRKKGG